MINWTNLLTMWRRVPSRLAKYQDLAKMKLVFPKSTISKGLRLKAVSVPGLRQPLREYALKGKAIKMPIQRGVNPVRKARGYKSHHLNWVRMDFATTIFLPFYLRCFKLFSSGWASRARILRDSET